MGWVRYVGLQAQRNLPGVGQVVGRVGEVARVLGRVVGCGRRGLKVRHGSRNGWRRRNGIRAEWDRARRRCGTWDAGQVRHCWNRSGDVDVDGRVCVGIAPVEGVGSGYRSRRVHGMCIVTTWFVASVGGWRLKRRRGHGCACSRESRQRASEASGWVGVETSPRGVTAGAGGRLLQPNRLCAVCTAPSPSAPFSGL